MDKDVNRNIKYSINTLAAEKLKPSDNAVLLCKYIAEGKMRSDKAVALIKRDYLEKLQLNNER